MRRVIWPQKSPFPGNFRQRDLSLCVAKCAYMQHWKSKSDSGASVPPWDFSSSEHGAGCHLLSNAWSCSGPANFMNFVIILHSWDFPARASGVIVSSVKEVSWIGCSHMMDIMRLRKVWKCSLWMQQRFDSLAGKLRN